MSHCPCCALLESLLVYDMRSAALGVGIHADKSATTEIERLLTVELPCELGCAVHVGAALAKLERPGVTSGPTKELHSTMACRCALEPCTSRGGVMLSRPLNEHPHTLSSRSATYQQERACTGGSCGLKGHPRPVKVKVQGTRFHILPLEQVLRRCEFLRCSAIC